MNRILVITDGDSDFLQLLQKNCNITVMSLNTVSVDANAFDALCVLVGNGNYPTNLSAPLQNLMDKTRRAGKPVFCEFVGPIGSVRLRGTESTERQRMVYNSKAFKVEGLQDGDLFDGHSNECIKFLPMEEWHESILTYQEYVCAHDNIKITEEKHKEGLRALWWLEKTTLISSIRLCNFRRARFTPEANWRALIQEIVRFLAGERITVEFEAPVCIHETVEVKSAADVKATVQRGLDWITNASILKDGGKGGAFEGFTNRITAKEGTHIRNNTIRTDCTCEIGGALLFDAFLTGNSKSREAAENLFKFAFDWLQVKEGEHRGMFRWSEDAWEWCYQDDVARAVLPLLLCQDFGVEVPYFEEIKDTLDYMLQTTSVDGIRPPMTEIRSATPAFAQEMRKAGASEPCAHFNAYYHAVLLLAYRISHKSQYLEAAERGLETIMSVYPDTRRETSETEEQCRLVLPLAILYNVTGKKEHYEWLCRVTDDLQKRRYSTGGYAEWDTGYKAFCSRNHKGECALLADNGDPIADLLYSNNWLPLAFSYAYFVTGEKRFAELWKDTASFMVKTQIHSEDKLLDGAWARAFDMDRNENYGIPHDVGWGPYCIESGWTVGEILMGLQFMQLAEKKHA